MDRLRTIAQARLRAKTIEIITFPKLGRPLDGTFLFILRAYRGQMTPFITFNIPKSHPECLVYKYIGSLPCLADPDSLCLTIPRGSFSCLARPYILWQPNAKKNRRLTGKTWRWLSLSRDSRTGAPSKSDLWPSCSPPRTLRPHFNWSRPTKDPLSHYEVFFDLFDSVTFNLFLFISFCLFFSFIFLFFFLSCSLSLLSLSLSLFSCYLSLSLALYLFLLLFISFSCSLSLLSFYLSLFSWSLSPF